MSRIRLYLAAASSLFLTVVSGNLTSTPFGLRRRGNLPRTGAKHASSYRKQMQTSGTPIALGVSTTCIRYLHSDGSSLATAVSLRGGSIDGNDVRMTAAYRLGRMIGKMLLFIFGYYCGQLTKSKQTKIDHRYQYRRRPDYAMHGCKESSQQHMYHYASSSLDGDGHSHPLETLSTGYDTFNSAARDALGIRGGDTVAATTPKSIGCGLCSFIKWAFVVMLAASSPGGRGVLICILLWQMRVALDQIAAVRVGVDRMANAIDRSSLPPPVAQQVNSKSSSIVPKMENIRGGGGGCGVHGGAVSLAYTSTQKWKIIFRAALAGFFFVFGLFRLCRPTLKWTGFDLLFFCWYAYLLRERYLERYLEKEKERNAIALDARRRQLPNWLHFRSNASLQAMQTQGAESTRRIAILPPEEQIDYPLPKLFAFLAFAFTSTYLITQTSHHLAARQLAAGDGVVLADLHHVGNRVQLK
mmetsp:Transcript_2505/g.7345  ORF Transcript_2505/g.7345 Transcript_2505/m.7345 type:complete len:470 (-) Transcript_2505:1195-2604(-)